MTNKIIKARIVHKHDTEENWNKATNFIPKQGEIIIYDKDTMHSYQRMKIGNGSTLVKKLPFVDNSDVKAEHVNFSDGQTFQQKLDNGSLKGEQGKPGKKGDVGPQGPAGDAGIVISNSQPTKENATVWIDPSGTESDFSNFLTKDDPINAEQIKFVDGKTFQQKLDDGSLRGENGTSVTHRWSGTELILTSASGTTRTNLQGPSVPKTEIQRMIDETLNGIAKAEEEIF